MKAFLFFLVTSFCCIGASAQLRVDTTQKVDVVETACGQCKFGMKGKGCSLAVRINGHAYFVDGTSIDEHGDAHAKDGFCNAIRKAEVQGVVVDNRYRATWFKLLKEAPSHH
jgi:hypothetical protein